MQTILITGSEGELGQALIDAFLEDADTRIVTFDIRDIGAPAIGSRRVHRLGDITDGGCVSRLFEEFDFDGVFHLAAILSSSGESRPERTHEVNVDGSLRVLSAAQANSVRRGAAVKVVFPSTMAVYGVPQSEKHAGERLKEDEFNHPITMYGINKLYAEQLGSYYSHHYRLLTSTPSDIRLDFRALRLPGIISAKTLPSGGTSDYGSEMIHAAAACRPYACFVPPQVRLPFMIMPDAVRALVEMYRTPRAALTRDVYNVGGFSVAAEEIAAKVKATLPHFSISYEPNPGRTQIAESWPCDLDDAQAMADWGWRPLHSFDKAFSDYLIPAITQRYEHLQRYP
jgi:nucleoside-diphosphate-sugar epimerase